MLCVELCFGHPQAFPLIGPQCTVGPCRDPLGCTMIPKQNGIKDKAPTLWLLSLLRLLQLLHACARAIKIGHAFTSTPPRSTVRDVDFDRFGLYCDAPHIFNCNRAEGSKVKVCPECDFFVTTSNQLVVHECLVLNHFCCCSRFDFSDILHEKS